MLLVAAIVPTAVGADKPVKLRFKFDKNKPLIYRTSSEIVETQTINGTLIVSTFTKNDVSVMTLQEIDKQGNLRFQSDNKLLKATLDITAGANKQSYKFDSALDEQEKGSRISRGLNPVFERLNGAAVTLTLTPNGTLKAVKGYQELLADVLKDNPLGTQIVGGGSDEALRVQLQDSLIQFGEKPVKPGDSWKVPYTLAIPKRVSGSGTVDYKLVGYETIAGRRVAQITFTTSGTFQVDIDMEGAKVTGEMKLTKADGTVFFDPARGQVVLNKATSVLSGTVSVEVNGATVTFETESAIKASFELLDKLPAK